MEKKYMVIIVVVVAVLVMVAALIASSLKRLNSYEVGLKYDTIWKKLGDKPHNEGLHTGPPGYKFIIFPSVFTSLEFDSLQCLNKDGVQITLDVSYQFRARPNELHTIISQFKDHDGYVEILKNAGNSAILEACSLFNTSQFQAERGKFQESVGLKLTTKYNELKCDVSEIQVSNINRPTEYETAIKSKEAARENIKVSNVARPREYENSIKTKEAARENIKVGNIARPNAVEHAINAKETARENIKVGNIARPGRYDNAVNTKETAKENIKVANIARPLEYDTIVKSKEAARESIKVAQNERPRKVTQAETSKREAETQAQITIAKAESQARIVLNKARTEAEAILDQFAKEAETYEALTHSSGLSLSNEAFLSYMGIRAIANAQNPVYVGMKGPAKTSYVTL